MVDWPHAPLHRLGEQGAYIVTAGTYLKQHLFRGEERLSLVRDRLFELADEYGWSLQAWAIFSNHYHFLGIAPDDASSLRRMIQRLHASTAIAINKEDGSAGRKVWHQYWETHRTFEKSYLARLNYVHQNPVKHGLVSVAHKYPWCSANWFERIADAAFVKTVNNFKIDRVNVSDDFASD